MKKCKSVYNELEDRREWLRKEESIFPPEEKRLCEIGGNLQQDGNACVCLCLWAGHSQYLVERRA